MTEPMPKEPNARDVLAELVRLKDLADANDRDEGEHGTTAQSLNTTHYLIARFAATWAAARSLLETKQGESRDEISVRALVHMLESSAANTDTDWRWRTASALRQCPQWESATLPLKSQQSDTGGKGC